MKSKPHKRICPCSTTATVAIVCSLTTSRSASIRITRSKPEGFDKECDRIFNLVTQAKVVRVLILIVIGQILLNVKERRSYNFRNWPSHSGNDKHTVRSSPARDG